LGKAFLGSLASHLNETHFRYSQRRCFGFVLLELFDQCIEHFVSVVLSIHVDEVEDNNAANIPEPKLQNYLFDSLKVGFDNCVSKGFIANKSASVNVNCGERFGALNDEISA